MPDDGKRYEAIGGELYVTPAPSEHHQRIVLRLAVGLYRLLDETGLGRLYLAPFGVQDAVASASGASSSHIVQGIVELKHHMGYLPVGLLNVAPVDTPRRPLCQLAGVTHLLWRTQARAAQPGAVRSGQEIEVQRSPA